MINELLKDFENEIEKTFKKELTIVCLSDMI